MKYRTILFAAALMLISGFVVQAADATGKWIAQFQARNGQTREATFNLKVDGEKLTGTMSAGRRENPISDGKVKGDEISFTVTTNARGNEVKMNYKGKVSGDEIKFTRMREGGGGQAQELVAKRAK
jgi:hypothetical protein